MPIKRVLSDTRVPVKIWTDDVEEMAITQLKNTANLPFVFKHVAVMPDVHFGMGATVGSVIATKGAICPCAVGVDIGCGMMAVKTALDHRAVQDKAKEIRHSIERSVPVGFDMNKTITSTVGAWFGWHMMHALPPASIETTGKTMSQMGTLGGGNHFIEICLDIENNVWVMLHSGSRNIGKKVADYHINKAKGVMQKYMISLPDPDLSYFVEQTEEFDDYMESLAWCQEYAAENRCEMMRRVLKDLSFACGFEGAELNRVMEVNCHHNYVEKEHHYGENVIVTRKGAIRARESDTGIIPGSMGTRSYIVQGLGNQESFHSCSHGAGRRMSRTKARAQFSKEDLAKQTEGVECRKDEGVLDEIPASYKKIEDVMENQSDLVEVIAELRQIVCVKG